MSANETKVLPLTRPGNDYQCVAGRVDETHVCVDKFGGPWDRPGVGPRPGTRCHVEAQRRLDAEKDGCLGCLSSGPSHNGSTFCESGSIASGGNRSHCTCDRCF